MGIGVNMSTNSHDAKCLVRIGNYTAELERCHLWGTDDDIDQEFNTVCRAIWDFTLDDFDDDSLSEVDHNWLDQLTVQSACEFAIENGYDLGDYTNGEVVSDWWGSTWMILAGKRALLTPEQRALAWKKHDARLLAREVKKALRIRPLQNKASKYCEHLYGAARCETSPSAGWRR
jgi:hypothetical protein